MRLGQLPAEGAHQRHRQRPRHAGRQAQRDAASQPAAQARQLIARASHLMQDAARVLQQDQARFGRHGAAAVALQQVLAQLHLQQSHLAADGRLGHVQRQRGTAEAAELGDADEIFELSQVHGIPA